MTNLRTDYKDDVLNTSVNTRRKFNMVNNSDGTVSFEDATIYTQIGDSFGAFDINETNHQIEELKKSVSDGKTIVADAITAKGVETATDASFVTMAANILALETGAIDDVSYADEVCMIVSNDTTGTATTELTLQKNSTYILVSFYSWYTEEGSQHDVNCRATEITAVNSGGELENLKLVNGCWEGCWRGHRVDKVVTGNTDITYTASCSTSGAYRKRLILNTVAVSSSMPITEVSKTFVTTNPNYGAHLDKKSVATLLTTDGTFVHSGNPNSNMPTQIKTNKSVYSTKILVGNNMIAAESGTKKSGVGKGILKINLPVNATDLDWDYARLNLKALWEDNIEPYMNSKVYLVGDYSLSTITWNSFPAKIEGTPEVNLEFIGDVCGCDVTDLIRFAVENDMASINIAIEHVSNDPRWFYSDRDSTETEDYTPTLQLLKEI